MYVWAKMESQPDGTKGTGTLIYSASLWARLWLGFLRNIICTTVSRHSTGHHFVKEKTKTGVGEVKWYVQSSPSDSFPSETEPWFNIWNYQNMCQGKTQQHATAGTMLYVFFFFDKYVISKILRRKSWLQFGTISFTCNKAPVSAGTPKQKEVSVLINVLLVVVEGEDSYQLQELLRGFYCVI